MSVIEPSTGGVAAVEGERFGLDIETLAHDLRRPIAALNLAIEMLQASHHDLSLERVFNVLRDNAQLLSQLVQLHSVAVPAAIASTEVASVIEELRSALAPSLLARRQSLRIVTTARPVVVPVNRADLIRMILNLADNASRYGPLGDRILVKLMRRGGWVAISVVDHGPGVGGDEWATLFDRGHRGSNAADDGGRGLGLHIVQDLAKRNGGEIRLFRRAQATVARLVLPEVDPSWR